MFESVECSDLVGCQVFDQMSITKLMHICANVCSGHLFSLDIFEDSHR